MVHKRVGKPVDASDILVSFEDVEHLKTLSLDSLGAVSRRDVVEEETGVGVVAVRAGVRVPGSIDEYDLGQGDRFVNVKLTSFRDIGGYSLLLSELYWNFNEYGSAKRITTRVASIGPDVVYAMQDVRLALIDSWVENEEERAAIIERTTRKMYERPLTPQRIKQSCDVIQRSEKLLQALG